MKTLKILFVLCLSCNLGIGLQAQIGIGTDDPNGILDLNSTQFGLIFPTVSLTSTTSESPVVNPAGGSLAVGTTVYNDNITSTGSNDVHTGLYTWTGSFWAPQFVKREFVKFEQTSVGQRIAVDPGGNPDSGNQTYITGLTGQTFVPTYSGTYRIEVKTNFAGGEVTNFASGSDDISLCTTEGSFFFTMNGPGVDIDPTSAFYDYTEGWSYTHAYSVHNDSDSPAIDNNNMTHNGTLLYYLYLRAGQNYDIDLGINLHTGDGYLVNSGASGDGRGYVGSYQPCSISFEYIGD